MMHISSDAQYIFAVSHFSNSCYYVINVSEGCCTDLLYSEENISREDKVSLFWKYELKLICVNTLKLKISLLSY